MSDDPILSTVELTKTYSELSLPITVLNRFNVSIQRGEQVAIVGPSGSGKSTLLQILGGLDEPTSGQVILNGKDLAMLSEQARTLWRNRYLGFVYQFHHLLPEFSALENVCFPLLLGECSVKEAKVHAKAMLEAVGLGKRLMHRLGQLSGGERQRVAIARALVNDPLCVLADEPTGNLDRQTAQQVYRTMLALNREKGSSLVIVTHDQSLAEQMDRVVTLCDEGF